MKYLYGITKYNPIFRDNRRVYLKDEWTAYSDIGKTFDGVILTETNYLEIEDSYVAAIYDVMNFLSITSIHVSQLIKSFGDKYFKSIVKRYPGLYTHDITQFYFDINR